MGHLFDHIRHAESGTDYSIEQHAKIYTGWRTEAMSKMKLSKTIAQFQFEGHSNCSATQGRHIVQEAYELVKGKSNVANTFNNEIWKDCWGIGS